MKAIKLTHIDQGALHHKLVKPSTILPTIFSTRQSINRMVDIPIKQRNQILQRTQLASLITALNLTTTTYTYCYRLMFTRVNIVDTKHI